MKEEAAGAPPFPGARPSAESPTNGSRQRLAGPAGSTARSTSATALLVCRDRSRPNSADPSRQLHFRGAIRWSRRRGRHPDLRAFQPWWRRTLKRADFGHVASGARPGIEAGGSVTDFPRARRGRDERERLAHALRSVVHRAARAHLGVRKAADPLRRSRSSASRCRRTGGGAPARLPGRWLRQRRPIACRKALSTEARRAPRSARRRRCGTSRRTRATGGRRMKAERHGRGTYAGSALVNRIRERSAQMRNSPVRLESKTFDRDRDHSMSYKGGLNPGRGRHERLR